MIELDGKVIPPSFKKRFKMFLNRMAAKAFKATKVQEMTSEMIWSDKHPINFRTSAQ